MPLSINENQMTLKGIKANPTISVSDIAIKTALTVKSIKKISLVSYLGNSKTHMFWSHRKMFYKLLKDLKFKYVWHECYSTLI